MHYGEFALMDYSESVASFRVYFGAITAVSLPGFLAGFGALRNALDGITEGTIQKERWVGDETILDNIPPSNPMAQRELKWRVGIEDETGQIGFGFTVATPDLSVATYVYDGRQYADFLDVRVAAFAAALEAIIVDPINGAGNCFVYEMEIVGRNL